MPNDFDIIKDHVINGNTQAAYDHLMANYRQDDGLRHEIRAAILADPEVKKYYEDNPLQGVLGGLGRGGIFEGGDKRRLEEHLAQQDRAEAEALARQNAAKEHTAQNEILKEQNSPVESTKDKPLLSNQNEVVESQKGPLQQNDPNLITAEDQSIIDDILRRKEDLSSVGYSQGFVLPDKLPATGGDGNLDYLDYVKFAKDSYKDNRANSLPEGFVEFDIDENWRNGYRSTTYINHESKEIVIGYSGSDDLLRDWAGNFKAAGKGVFHPHFDDALATYTKALNSDYGAYNISLTGHSLGGYLAEMVAYSTGDVHAISFDPLHATHLTQGYSNIWRVLPSGTGAYHFSKWYHQRGYPTIEELAEMYGMSEYNMKVELAAITLRVGRNHPLENIITEIFNDTLVVDTLNKKAQHLYDRSTSLFG